MITISIEALIVLLNYIKKKITPKLLKNNEHFTMGTNRPSPYLHIRNNINVTV